MGSCMESWSAIACDPFADQMALTKWCRPNGGDQIWWPDGKIWWPTGKICWPTGKICWANGGSVDQMATELLTRWHHLLSKWPFGDQICWPNGEICWPYQAGKDQYSIVFTSKRMRCNDIIRPLPGTSENSGKRVFRRVPPKGRTLPSSSKSYHFSENL